MKRKGFSLIELLVVIAIIGILAAILLPVFTRAKAAAKKRADSTNMSSIYHALKLYREDQGGYPPLLLAAAEYNGNTLQRVDDIRRGFLYRGRVKDVNTFTSVEADFKKDALTNACWPSRDPRSNGNPPTDRQFIGTQDGSNAVTYAHLGILPSDPGANPTSPASFYRWDVYDTAPTVNPGCSVGRELRYILFWTGAGQAGGAPTDNQRQLGYNDPRDDTVVTWNTYFQDMNRNSTPNLPKHSRSAMVLFLSGSVKDVDAKDLYDRSWRFGQ